MAKNKKALLCKDRWKSLCRWNAGGYFELPTADFGEDIGAVPVRGDGASTRVFALESTPGYNPEPGPVQATGRNLDVAMQGKAWLAVLLRRCW